MPTSVAVSINGDNTRVMLIGFLTDVVGKRVALWSHKPDILSSVVVPFRFAYLRKAYGRVTLHVNAHVILCEHCAVPFDAT